MNIKDEIKEIKKRIKDDQELLAKKQKEWEENKEYIDIPILHGKNKSDIQKMFNLTPEQANKVLIELMDKSVRYWFSDERKDMYEIVMEDEESKETGD